MDLPDALAHAAAGTHGVLVTIRRDARPQLSNIAYRLSGGTARISVTGDRAKTRNLRRDPRATLYVPGRSFWSYAVLEGTAELSPVATDPEDPTVNELVELYRSIRGEDHPDWGEFRRAMVEEGRLVVRLTFSRAYGIPGE